MDREKLYSDLRQAEGLRQRAYKDSRGFWTAGVGHYLDQTIDWTGHVFEPEQIEQWLEEDVDKAFSGAQTLEEWGALDTPARQNAVVELVFNMGLTKWRCFKKSRAALARRQWAQAKDQLLDSEWAREVQPSRRDRIAGYILSGQFT